MRLYLFLDDWMLDDYHNIVRRFGRPEPAPMEPATHMPNYTSVLWEPELGKYRCWYAHYMKLSDGRRWAVHCLDESQDGWQWQPVNHGGPTDPRAPEKKNSLRYWKKEPQAMPCVVHRDDHDQDPQRRYKGVFPRGQPVYSPDGVHWTPDLKHPTFTVPAGSDTHNSIIFNPVTGRYQVFHRPANLDRRVAIAESEDLETWTESRVVIHPDVLDEPLLQFYGITPLWYEDLFLAMLWDHHISATERGSRAKMAGFIDNELAYSYDGRNWLRTDRKPFVGLAEYPAFGWGGMYAHSFLVDHEDRVRIYSMGYQVEHGDSKRLYALMEAGQPFGAMTAHTLRKDGFAYLQPPGGWGYVAMRGLIPKDADLRINYQAMTGKMLVQLSDEEGKVLPGFSFRECYPMTGDEVYAKPRWKKKRLRSVVGKWVRLEFRLFCTRLFAVRWNSQTHYSVDPLDRI